MADGDRSDYVAGAGTDPAALAGAACPAPRGGIRRWPLRHETADLPYHPERLSGPIPRLPNACLPLSEGSSAGDGAGSTPIHRHFTDGSRLSELERALRTALGPSGLRAGGSRALARATAAVMVAIVTLLVTALNEQAPLGTPLLDPDRAEDTLVAILNHCRALRPNAGGLMFQLALDGPPAGLAASRQRTGGNK